VTQNQTILAYLKLHPITSARIYDLRAQGHQIRTDMVGKGNTRYARYTLVEGNTE
jgi:predicted Zn-dependent protease